MLPHARWFRLTSCLAATCLLGAALSASEVQLAQSGGDVSDGFAGGGMFFGADGGPAVARDGDVIVVGNSGDDLPGQGNQGSASVFRWNGSAWIEEQTLIASGGDGNDNFGWSVAICGPVIAVSAPFAEVLGVSEQGSVTVFRWNGSLWVEEQTLSASGGVAFDGFGWSISMNGDVIVVGAKEDDVGLPFPLGSLNQGTATVFRWNGTTWDEEQTLVASAGVANDRFGCAVSVSGQTIVVGASEASPGGLSVAGTATVFRYDGSIWIEEQTLTPAAAAAGDSFGNAVAVSGDVIVCGSPYHATTGTATVYRWDGASWNEEQTLVSSTGSSSTTWARFGASLAIRGHTIAVGAFFNDVSWKLAQGTVTIFRWDSTSWAGEPDFTSLFGAAHDGFGACVALYGDDVLVGSPHHPMSGHFNQGAAYLFDKPGPTWSDQGSALRGVFGDPLLAGSGDLSVGSDNVVELMQAAPDATAGLFLALSSTPVPFKGGTLMPFPFFPIELLTTSDSGTLPIAFSMPTGAPAGTELWVQWAIQDAAAIHGVALSNALRGITP